MNDINQLFFELIRVSLGNQERLSRVPTAKEWERIYRMAVKQSLLGICFAGVQRLGANADDGFSAIGMPEMLYLTWMGMAAKIQQRNQVVDEQCVALQKRLSADGLRSSILKGQGVGQLYAEHLRGLRQSGDIDVYVPGGMKRVLGYIKHKYGVCKYDYINAHVPIYIDTEVELHWRPQAMRNLVSNRRLQKWLNMPETINLILEEKVTLISSENSSSPSINTIVVPAAEFNAFYILLHCFHHMFDEGLGLRQLMDYFFVLKTARFSEEQKLRVLKQFQQFGMMKFVTAVMWIMQNVFGLEDAYLLCESNKAEGEFILEQVMIGGNFGHYDERKKKFKDYRIQSLVSSTQHNWHLFTHYPSKVFWAPIWLVWHFVWKRTIGRI